MAILLKRSGSPYFVAAFDITLPDGTVRRLKKSTKKKKRSDAMVEALRLEELAKKESATTTGQEARAYEILKEAAESASKGQLSEPRARLILAKLAELSTGSPLEFFTVRSWAEHWLSSKSSSVKQSTLTRYEGSIRAFLAWLGEKAESRLESVTSADIRNFRNQIRLGWRAGKKSGGKRTAKTANDYADDVASMFRAAVLDTVLLVSPAAGLEDLPEEDSTEREVFKLPEITELIAAAGRPEWQRLIFSEKAAKPEIEEARQRDWQGMILIGLYAGPRIQDAANLKWKNVDLDLGMIRFMPGKTSRKRKILEVPIHPRLGEFLRNHSVARSLDAPVFPSLFEKRVSGNVGLSSCFGAIMDAASIDRRTLRHAEKDKSGKIIRRAVHARSFHSLRHSLTSSLADLDVAAEIRQRIVGHDTAAVHQDYTHFEREKIAKELRKLPHV